MKKTFLIFASLLAIFVFATSFSASAQWSADVYWDDNSCSCFTITSKILKYELWRVSDQTLIASGEEDITNESSPFTISGTETIVYDTQYALCVKIFYYNAQLAEPLCCDGDKCDPEDGQDLINGDSDITVIMN